jgi:hypothetical protein
LLAAVFGANWLVVAAGFGGSEGIDWAFWADGIELGEEAPEEEGTDGADELS